MGASAEFDHLVVAAATLEQGEAYLEERLGTRPQRGGKHETMGTHNSLLKLGAKSFIEVIAVDPEAPAPRLPRWFALDTHALQSNLQGGPRLIHWVVRTADIAAARQALGLESGTTRSMTRGGYTWWIAIAPDGALPAGGVLPSLIQWADARHPAEGLPDSGLRLLTLAGAHPAPDLVRAPLAALELSAAIKITYGAVPRLAAMLHTPRGPVTL
jgi:hypothetical protein